ncbi:ribosome maturation factor rimM [Enterococcus faecalis EnGen0080]|uniref:ribosome maturation factor RimM n=1 Tax=Enterococcus faecalis TaxID=1351 RepID=UPI00032FDA01|nr:ribosome maturation factor RimM [Enterococcus faecalis]EOE14291.1 ribosome maturation factor rimM [Enterococcus faecalis EnGen0080]
MTDYLNVGKIVNTQGIKGEVRVISKTDFPEERYQKGATLLLFQEKKAPIELVVESHRKHKNFDILSFEGHPNINDVEKYSDGILKVAKDNLAELGEDEFYYHQIIGATVYDETGSELGKIKEILSPGANDVWVVQRPKKKDLLLPYIEGVVTKVDVENQRIDVDIPEGLIDDEN